MKIEKEFPVTIRFIPKANDHVYVRNHNHDPDMIGCDHRRELCGWSNRNFKDKYQKKIILWRTLKANFLVLESFD